MIGTHRPRAGTGLALLVLAFGASAQSSADAKKELEAIQKELKQEYKELRAATKEAADDEAADALYREFQEGVLPEFAGRYAAVARANSGSDVAIEAWMHVFELVQQGYTGAVASEALKTLTADYMQSSELTKLAMTLRYCAPGLGEESVLSSLRSIATGSPHRETKAAALFNLGAVLGEERAANDPKLAEAKKVLAQLADYADVEYMGGRSYAEVAATFVFALENLVVGKPCPDFGAVDAEGAGFKLNDYKGKVVLVDFWGFW
jgi:hypothetical protein